MHPAGLTAFAARRDDRSPVYAYEQRRRAKLDPEQERSLRANEDAWEFFSAQPPSYRRTAVWWIVSAKREKTRSKRLATLIEDSANGRRIKALTRRERH
jgi:uncharacterized protein YdeI (YjbR/CyaY-like superfamily)